MDMLSKLTSLFQQALETREPSVDLLESFVEHWKGITNYYIVTTDESRPVKQTDIPWRLKQMLDILVYEEREQGLEETGPCMEYLLQHKILETLCTLGKAQYPPGMSQQVLLFFSRLLAQIQKPMLHLINVYKPVQKLIRLCSLPGSQTEREEAQFLLIVCSRVKQDPYVLHYILEIKDNLLPQRPGSTPDQPKKDRRQSSNHKTETIPFNQSNPLASPSIPASSRSDSSASSHEQSDVSISSSSQSDVSMSSSGLIYALVQLSKSQRNRVCLKAYESLLLLVGLQGTEECLANSTQLCELLAGRLAQLYSLLPLHTLDPQDIHTWPHTHWSGQFSQQPSSEDSLLFPGSDDMTSFFSWLDFLDHLMSQASKVLAEKLAQAVHQHWLLPVLQPQLLQMSEPGVLVSTVLLCAVVRHVHSSALLDQLLLFLLGGHTDTHTDTQPDTHTDTHPDTHTDTHPETHIDTHTDIHTDTHTDTHADTHTDTHAQPDTHTDTQSDTHTHPEQRLDTHTHTLRYQLIEHCDHISDEISMATLRLFEELLQKPQRDILTNLVLRNLESRCYLTLLPPAGAEDRHTDSTEDEELEEDPFFPDSMYSDSEFLCSDRLLFPAPPRCSSPPHSEHTQAADIVNSFLCLVPQEAKSSHLVQGAGYDTYVHDAHRLCKESLSLSEPWGWQEMLPPPSSSSSDFYEGHLLKVLFDRLGRILEQPYELNLQLTSVLSRLAVFQHPLIQEYLLDPYITLSPGARSLFSVLIRVIGQLMQRIQFIPDVTDRLVRVRRHLMGQEDEPGMDHVTLLRGVIVLEEFCKELAAIAFVKMPLDDN